jgi:hypothetical protein
MSDAKDNRFYRESTPQRGSLVERLRREIVGVEHPSLAPLVTVIMLICNEAADRIEELERELASSSETSTNEDAIRDDECAKIIKALDARGSADTLIHPHEAQVTHRKPITIRHFLQHRTQIRQIQRGGK